VVIRKTKKTAAVQGIVWRPFKKSGCNCISSRPESWEWRCLLHWSSYSVWSVCGSSLVHVTRCSSPIFTEVGCESFSSLQVLIPSSTLGGEAVSGPLIWGCFSQPEAQANIYDRTSPELLLVGDSQAVDQPGGQCGGERNEAHSAVQDFSMPEQQRLGK
jgi:hypothetical protein